MDWVSEWKKIQDRSVMYRAVKRDQEESYWSKYAPNYDDRRCWGEGINRELEVFEGFLDSSTSVLEVGAGTGALTLPVARLVKSVTAVEPSPSMLGVLRGKIEKEGVDNISVVNAKWEDAEVEIHDVVIAAGCLYVFYDIDNVLNKMLEKSRKGLILMLGTPLQGQCYGEAARFLHIQAPLLGPNFIHLYNVLWQLGIYANVNIIRARKAQIYESLEHVLNLWAERLNLAEEKLPCLKKYLEERSSVTSSGELTLGEIEAATAVMCYRRNGFFDSLPG